MPPVQLSLSLLGRLDLRNAASEEVEAVLRQPKRLALLTYLLHEGRGRWIRRDTLLALFWPELDAEHARAALRRALHFLRREIGAELLPGRGEEEVGVLNDAIRSDVFDFEAALRQGDLEGALALYQGDLLAGFYVAGAPEVERWLDGERERLRRLAAGAARTLGDRNPARAVEWAERAAALVPEDEEALRRLMVALERDGNLTRALRVYQGFVERLRTDLGIAPTDATRRLADRLRAMLAARPASGGLGVALPSAPGPSRASLVAVCPFQVNAPERLEYLGEALMQLLSAALDGAGPVQTVEPNALHAALRGAGVDAVEPAVGLRIARHFGAGRFVIGSVVEGGGRLRAVAALYDDGGKVRERVEASAPSEDSLFELADGLGRGLLQHLGEVAAGTAARTTGSLEALKAYLGGGHALRNGRYAEAVQGFRAATTADPTFALGFYRLAGSLAGLAVVDEARQADELAYRHRTRLSDHDRQLVEAQHAWLSGASGEAEGRYAALVSAYPESLEGWFHLGDVQFHSNPDRGRSVAEARLAFERAIRLDPEHVGALAHLARTHALEGRRGDLRAQAERMLALSPEADHGFAIRALRAFAGGEEAERDAVLAEVAVARGFAILNGFVDIALHARDLAGAERFARTAVAAARSDEFQALTRLGLACALLGQDHGVQAQTELQEVTRLVPAWGIETRAVIACLPGAEPAAEELGVLADTLDTNGSAAPPTIPGPLQLLARMSAHVRAYLRALVALRQGRRPDALHHAESLNELDVPPGCESEVEHLVRVVEAEGLRAAGEPEPALRLLHQVKRGIWYQIATWSPVFAGTHERLLRSALLIQLGRRDEAGRMLRTLAQRSPFELMGLGPARRLQGGQG